MNSATERPFSRAEFERRLLGATGSWSFADTRFYRLLAAGRCPPSLLQRYAAATYRGARLFCASLAALAAAAPDPGAKLVLLENLMEEEGVDLLPGTGLRVRPGRGHVALAERFVAACGGFRDAAESPAHHALDPGRDMLNQGRWLDACAFLLIGQELNFSSICALMVPPLRRHGIAARDLAFFQVHIAADAKHGREALDLLLERARTAAEQKGCIDAATAGARTWFDRHGAGAPASRGMAA
jgi:pyrroloquinoline quinone (PQQ) biosynthesis protein C